jgi:hypothetical protein
MEIGHDFSIISQVVDKIGKSLAISIQKHFIVNDFELMKSVEHLFKDGAFARH